MLLWDSIEMAFVNLALCSFSLDLMNKTTEAQQKMFKLLQRLTKLSGYILARSEIHKPTAGYSASCLP